MCNAKRGWLKRFENCFMKLNEINVTTIDWLGILHRITRPTSITVETAAIHIDTLRSLGSKIAVTPEKMRFNRTTPTEITIPHAK